ILVGIVFLTSAAPAQERKIEIAPFAGGYFSAGFQSFHRGGLGPILIAATPGRATALPFTFGELKPVDEPNSGIFGVRASYDLSRRFTLEGTFGFSPAGRQFTPLAFPQLVSVLADAPQSFPPQPTPPQPAPPRQGEFVFPGLEALLSGRLPLVPSVRGKDTFHYSGNVLFRWPGARGWSPFITGGLGAVTRTAEVSSVSRPPILILGPSGSPSGGAIAPIVASIFVPAPIDTDLAVNFGGGVKKYLSSRCGIRFDFRDYVSKVDGDTVHNLEASLGVIFRF
ncbi:MAG: hypothetical protein ACRD88_10915, partial [Terriglobia bacterium]